MDDHYKHPRLYVDQSLERGRAVALAEGQAHYLRTVLRKNTGEHLRLFNEKDGEWLAILGETGKKSAIAVCAEQIRAPQAPQRRLHMFFPPLGKDRLDFLVEKAVELGASDLHPITTARTEVRKINTIRIMSQIIEAAEQCERHDIPHLHDLAAMETALAAWDQTIPVFAALERADAQPLDPQSGDCAVLVGPPGGFTPDEKTYLANLPFVKPVTLGPRILRTETAALAALSLLSN